MIMMMMMMMMVMLVMIIMMMIVDYFPSIKSDVFRVSLFYSLFLSRLFLYHLKTDFDLLNSYL